MKRKKNGCPIEKKKETLNDFSHFNALNTPQKEKIEGGAFLWNEFNGD